MIEITDTIDNVKATITLTDLDDIKVEISQETLDELASDPDIIDLCEHHIKVGSHNYLQTTNGGDCQ